MQISIQECFLVSSSEGTSLFVIIHTLVYIYYKFNILFQLILYETDFSFPTLFFVTGWKHCPMPEKISQKWVEFAFGSAYFHQTYTEYVFNQYTYFYISIYQMWQHVMERPLILSSFFWVFSYIFDEHSCLKYSISAKL